MRLSAITTPGTKMTSSVPGISTIDTVEHRIGGALSSLGGDPAPVARTALL
jgi:hypothetical protein